MYCTVLVLVNQITANIFASQFLSPGSTRETLVSFTSCSHLYLKNPTSEQQNNGKPVWCVIEKQIVYSLNLHPYAWNLLAHVIFQALSWHVKASALHWKASLGNSISRQPAKEAPLRWVCVCVQDKVPRFGDRGAKF